MINFQQETLEEAFTTLKSLHQSTARFRSLDPMGKPQSSLHVALKMGRLISAELIFIGAYRMGIKDSMWCDVWRDRFYCAGIDFGYHKCAREEAHGQRRSHLLPRE